MPKSKVRSKTEFSEAAAVNRTPVKVNGTPTARWYLVLMLLFLIVGLAWLVAYYLWGEHIPFMKTLETWQNFAIGFGLMIVGLLMTMGCR